MKIIRVTSSVSTGLDPALAAAKTIEIEDQPMGQGAFGVAYGAGRFDGNTVTPQVVKILIDTGNGAAKHGFDTVRGLQSLLRAENQRMSGKLIQTFPALQAVPQLSFEGVLNGRPVIGYSANNLTHNGFTEFGKILDDDTLLATLQDLPMAAKMRIAYELVAAFDFLKSTILFIHADIKAEALFLDLKGMHCAIIDFDGGALASNVNDSPTTFGTPQDWLAPEIARQLTTPGSTGKIKVNLSSDAWAVNIAIHYLLFGVTPFFFLSEVSDRSIDAFLKRYQWPDCDPTFRYFQPGMAQAHQAYLAYVRKAARREIVEKLKVTINKGYRTPAQRIMYGSWKILLGSLTQPAIREFNADRYVVDDGRKVHLTWDTTGAAKLELTGVGSVTNRTSADVTVVQDSTFDLILTAEDGSQQTRSITITTDQRPPLISFFGTSIALLTIATPARLTWKVERAARLQIDQGVGDVTLPDFVEVLPRSNTRYSLTATSYFGATSTAVVDVQVSDRPPTIALFQADSKLLEGGRPVTLRWEVSADAEEVAISELGKVARAGTQTIEQRRAVRYVLTATSYFGQSSSAVLDVQVSQAKPVIQEFSVAPTLLHYGSEISMRWHVSNAEHVWLDPDGRNLPASGAESTHPAQTTRFILHAATWYGVQVDRRIDVTVLRRTRLDRTQVTKLDRTVLTKLPTRR